MGDSNIDVVAGFAEIPDSEKGLRACLRCSLVKTFTQFHDSGCENCDFLGMVGEMDKVHECTTSYFAGTVALIQPIDSWVARWQRIITYIPGLYALAMQGRLPDDMLELCESYNYEVVSNIKNIQASGR
jgi:transcription elongation factor SPT4